MIPIVYPENHSKYWTPQVQRIGIGVMKTGTHLLAVRMENPFRIHFRTVEETLSRLKHYQAKSVHTLVGHCRYDPEIVEFLSDWEITFLTRDPRDVIVSRYYWDADRDWDVARDKTLEQCINLVQWEPLAKEIISFEYLVTKNYTKNTPTFRKGLVGEWKKELPDGLYDESFDIVKHWEVG